MQPQATSASTLLPGALGSRVSLSEMSCDVVKETWLTFPSYIHGCQDSSEILHLLSFHHRFAGHRPVLNLLHLVPGELLGSSWWQCQRWRRRTSRVGREEGQ